MTISPQPEQSVRVRLFINALPPDLSSERVAELLQEYRQERARALAGRDGPPTWYIEQLIAALEALVADRQVAA